MGRGGSENAAALWISVEVRGLEKGWGPEWSPRSSLLQSGPPALHSQGKGPREAPPRCSEAGWGMARLAAQCAKGAACRVRVAGRPAQSSAASVHLRWDPVLVHSLRAGPHHPAFSWKGLGAGERAQPTPPAPPGARHAPHAQIPEHLYRWSLLPASGFQGL
uniref:Uncharacterized protein n=1 Tax=Lynx canadensis TaxID=61383 RepID=A0A667HIN8_LYNCA